MKEYGLLLTPQHSPTKPGTESVKFLLNLWTNVVSYSQNKSTQSLRHTNNPHPSSLICNSKNGPETRMLTREDLKWCYKIYDLASSLCIFPLPFQNEPLGSTGGLERWGFWCWWVGVAGSVLWGSIRTLLATRGENPNWHFIPVCAILQQGCLTVLFWSFFLCIENPQLTLKLFVEMMKVRGENGQKIPTSEAHKI
jgi:hypothetical protein